MSITVTDLFAGAGGSSTGMVDVPGVRVVMAANHWPLAIAVHNQNHPDTDHAAKDLHEEDPRYFPKTDVLWASPECTKWSQANGSKPLPSIEEGLFEDPLSDEAAQRSRLLMFDVLRFAEHHRYRVMIVENVVDIATQAKYRLAWHAWRQQLAGLGYRHRVVSLNSMHAQTFGAPAPQSRDRIYIVCWLDGTTAPDLDRALRPQAWCARCEQMVESTQAWKPGKTVGRYRQSYVYIHSGCGTVVEPGYLPAAAAIDWSIPGERIGDRLKPKTRARIAAGIARYWGPFHIEAAGQTYDAADPNHPQHGHPGAYYRAWSAADPIRALHGTASKGLAVPVEGRDGKSAQQLDLPMRTQTTRLETALVTRHFGTVGGAPARHTTPAAEELRTLTANGGNMSLLTPFVAELRGGGSDARSVDEPAATFCASGQHHALVVDNNHVNRARRAADEAMGTLTTATTKALLSPYYGNADAALPIDEPVGTLTTVDRYALVHRNNTGGAEMTTSVAEYLRTLTTAGHQALIQGGPRGGRPPVSPADLKAAEAMVPECLFRMFRPHEVAAGMAFPDTYDWNVLTDKGKPPTNRDLVKMAGNAVTPPAARDLMGCVAATLERAA